MMVGCRCRATANNALTIFSPSPTYPKKPNPNQFRTKSDHDTYLEVNEDALMLKNVALASEATAFANIVLPFPGGPNNNNPLGGLRRPVKISGRSRGRMTISLSACLAFSKPAVMITNSKSDH